MGTVGRSILHGIDADRVVELLNRAYCDEWRAYYQYFVEAKVVRGPMKDAAIAELTEHAADELRHANLLADRILQLGGIPVLDPGEWQNHSNCGYEAPDDAAVLRVLEQAIKGERCAIQTYSALLETTREKDIVTYEMVADIFADEVEHEEDLQSLYEDIEEMLKTLRT